MKTSIHLLLACCFAMVMGACGTGDQQRDTSGDVASDEDTVDGDVGDDASGEDTSGEDTSGEDTTGEDTSGEDTSVEDTSGEDTTLEDASSDASVGAELLCRDSGGRWDAFACGHYACGAPNECAAIIPGCDCGDSANFVDGVGCVADSACGGGDEEALCVATGGAWDEGSCGHYGCGLPPACLAIIPGCNCGPGHNFDAGEGCYGDATCGFIDEETLCQVTGGDWEEFTCGPSICGAPRPETCFVPFPACNCGTARAWSGGAGCIDDNDCDECPDASDPRAGYLSTDPEECALIDFLCDAGTYAFGGSCGCGCYEALPRPPE